MKHGIKLAGLALLAAGAVYAGVGVGGGSQIITVDSATQAGIDATVAASNAVLQAEMLASNAVQVAGIASKVTTNATLDALSTLDGSTLTNLTLNNIVGIDSKVTTNAALAGFIVADGTNLLWIAGGVTNQVTITPLP